MRFPRCLVVGRFAVLVAVFLMLPRVAEAQAASAPRAVSTPRTVPAAENDAYQILTYDVSDLLLDVPDYPYPNAANLPMPVGGMGAVGMPVGGMGGGGMFNVAASRVGWEAWAWAARGHGRWHDGRYGGRRK